MTKLSFNWSKTICWPSGDSPNNTYQGIEGSGSSEKLLLAPEILPADQLNRAETASFLTELAKLKKIGYVLNLNCPWGTGKTWFLKRWYLSLKGHNPVVYIDAWKYDHHNSPLLILLQHIVQSLQDQSPEAKGMLEHIKRSRGFAMAKVLLPELVKATCRIDLEKLMENSEWESKKSAVDELASKTTSLLLDSVSKENEAIDELKRLIAKSLDKVVASERLSYPVFIFVDELDRCRPTFAIEVLEAIKHVFDIPYILFVIATDSEQLQHSINAVYGEKFGSYNYLKRFFNASFQLELPAANDFVQVQSEFKTLYDSYKADSKDIYEKLTEEQFATLLAGLASDLELSLRTIKQWLSRMALVCELKKTELSQVPFFSFVSIAVLKEKSFSSYQSITSVPIEPRDPKEAQIIKAFIQAHAAKSLVRMKIADGISSFYPFDQRGDVTKKFTSQSFLHLFLGITTLSKPQSKPIGHLPIAVYETIERYPSTKTTLKSQIDRLLELTSQFSDAN